ncbi:Uncharacterised protein [Candidatus Norongarragalina meridionalis]|nr:Uncharacterised protein [Candidatus Norongarragalina meridionalis]
MKAGVFAFLLFASFAAAATCPPSPNEFALVNETSCSLYCPKIQEECGSMELVLDKESPDYCMCVWKGAYARSENGKIITLGAAVFGVLAVAGYLAWKKRKEKERKALLEEEEPPHWKGGA